jgi:hypothetical protein
VGFRAGLDEVAKRKEIPGESNPGNSARSLVAILTELSHVLFPWAV